MSQVPKNLKTAKLFQTLVINQYIRMISEGSYDSYETRVTAIIQLIIIITSDMEKSEKSFTTAY